MEYHLQWFFMCAIIVSHFGVDLCEGHTNRDPSYRIFLANDTDLGTINCHSACGYLCNCQMVPVSTGFKMQGEMDIHFSCVLNSSIELSNIVMTLNCCDNQVQTVDVIILANTTNGTVTTLDGKLEGTCAEQPLRLNTTNPVFVDNIDIDIQIQTTVTNDQKECFEIPFNAVELFQETCSACTTQESIISTSPMINEQENTTDHSQVVLQRYTIITLSASVGGCCVICLTTVILTAIVLNLKRKKTVRFFHPARVFKDDDYEVTNRHYRNSVIPTPLSHSPTGNTPQTDIVYDLPQECLCSYSNKNGCTSRQLKDESDDLSSTSLEEPSNKMDLSTELSEHVHLQDSYSHNASGTTETPDPPSYDDTMKQQGWKKKPPKHPITICLNENNQEADRPVEAIYAVVQQVYDEATPTAMSHTLEDTASHENQEDDEGPYVEDDIGIVSETHTGRVVETEGKSASIQTAHTNVTSEENGSDTPKKETSEGDRKDQYSSNEASPVQL